MQGINDFLNKSTFSAGIGIVYTGTNHASYSKAALNELIILYPEYSVTLYCLSRLYALLWAEKERTKHLCLLPRDFSASERKMLSYSKEIVGILIGEIQGLGGAERSVMSSVHAEYTPISHFLMTQHYKNATERVCGRVYKRINALAAELVSFSGEMPAEERIPLHDLEILFELHFEDARKKSGSVDFETVLLDGAECIKSYGKSGIITSECLKSYILGKSDVRIADEIGRSRTFVKNRVEEGMFLLSVLYWGLSDKESLKWFGKVLK